MVKLPENEKKPAHVHRPMPAGDFIAMIERERIRQNFHINRGPSRLIELEAFADRAVSLVSTDDNQYQSLRQDAMNRVRMRYNLEFKLRCDVCGTAHYQDEISAPER